MSVDFFSLLFVYVPQSPDPSIVTSVSVCRGGKTEASDH